MPKIQNIGVARLFSTGRYEHTKISVNVEPGDKPGTMLKEIQGLIEDLNPNCPVEEWDLRRAKDRLTEKAEANDQDDPFGLTVESAQQTINRYVVWETKRDAAYARLDEIGAAPVVEDIDNTPVEG